MDYKYISQLLERYWNAETTLQEEEILKAFFQQDNVPADLLRYKALFSYQAQEVEDDRLGADFDEKMMSMICEPETVKAKIITFQQKLKPLFKAAAIVAIMLTLGNAAQVSLKSNSNTVSTAGTPALQHGQSVAISDSAAVDTLQHSCIETPQQPTPSLIK